MTTAQTAPRPRIALAIHTVARCYVVWHNDITAIRSCASQEEVAAWGTPERPGIAVDLGVLLDEAQPVWPRRVPGLVITMRRRPIVLLVDRVERMIEQPSITPLPELMRRALQPQWAAGVLYEEEQQRIVLDLREIARSILVQRSA